MLFFFAFLLGFFAEVAFTVDFLVVFFVAVVIDLDFFLADFLVDFAELFPVRFDFFLADLPKAESQPLAYFSLVPTRKIVMMDSCHETRKMQVGQRLPTLGVGKPPGRCSLKQSGTRLLAAPVIA